jgi:AcrR family transcriptional regulator
VQALVESGYGQRVPEREPGDQGSSEELPRLPPGRHGLDRDFVTRNQRDRLTAGIIAVVAERGYQDSTVTQICAAAGVSRRTFYSYFSSKEECYGYAFDLIGDFIVQAMRSAGNEGEPWPHLVQARLAALIEIFAANPDLVQFTVVVPLRAGESISGRHRLALERILAALTEGKDEAEQVREPSVGVQHALVGGVMSLIARRVESGGGKGLPDLLPDLVELFLTPYLGRDGAVRTTQKRI